MSIFFWIIVSRVQSCIWIYKKQIHQPSDGGQETRIIIWIDLMNDDTGEKLVLQHFFLSSGSNCLQLLQQEVKKEGRRKRWRDTSFDTGRAFSMGDHIKNIRN